jgi:hypothetical protein
LSRQLDGGHRGASVERTISCFKRRPGRGTSIG